MTTYCDPKTVLGPKDRVSNVRVLYDGGANSSSVAQLDWEGKPGVAIRWNGNSEDQPLGSPQSRGHPFWFLVPEEFADVVLERARRLAPDSDLESAYRAMAADTEREADALDWSNALIGDGTGDADHAAR